MLYVTLEDAFFGQWSSFMGGFKRFKCIRSVSYLGEGGKGWGKGEGGSALGVFLIQASYSR